jgi:molybdate transport system ATP-binding protein
MIEVDLETSLGDFQLVAKFESQTPVTALFGPSGAGKSSIIGAVAGLLRPERGRIVVAGRTLYDSERGIDVPAHKRGVRVVFQESRLFPHLSVRQNLLYGHWLTGRKAVPSLADMVALLDIGHLLRRKPRTLSGGERQRIALARALLANPVALLLDEPLASLDEARKEEILPYLERLVTETRIPILYVSHAREEIERLAETIVHLAGGRVSSVQANGGKIRPASPQAAANLPPSSSSM